MEHLACGQSKASVILIINIVLLILAIYIVQKRYNDLNNKISIAFAMVIGGGASNTIDRLYRGHVVDYIDINNIIKYPVFNLADIFIVLGVIFIIIYLIEETIKRQEK